MPVIERDLTYFEVAPSCTSLCSGDSTTRFVLISSSKSLESGFTWNLDFPLTNAFRIILTGPDRPRPPHDNLIPPGKLHDFKITSLDKTKCKAVIAFPGREGEDLSALSPNHNVEIRLSWERHIAIEIWMVNERDKGNDQLIMKDMLSRSYALTEHGIIRHYQYDNRRLHLGLGEKAAPIDLSGRSFTLHATDAAGYDSYKSDPLYKHTPYLISTPRPKDWNHEPGLTYAILHASNSVSTWDVGREADVPSGGWFKTFTQDWGGLEEWVMVADAVDGVVRSFAEIAGKPRLVGRDWLGYLASTMLLAELENAQEALSKFPEECRLHDIPCSAMHLSSGYTVGEKNGARMVFHMNKHRFPDFKGMIKLYHKAGIKVAPNVKPYAIEEHPDYERLKRNDAVFYDPRTKGPAVQGLWADREGSSKDGSWVDFSAQSARDWWSEGVRGLIKLGVDGMWDDNSEFFLRDDEITFKNEFDYKRESTFTGRLSVGLLGRITGNELMNKVSHETLQAHNPERRTYVLTRSGNVAAFKYACATWTGDNFSSWHNLRGSQHIQLNAGLSLMQSTGSDVGGFVGDPPSMELLVRWVQLGVTHARFCIHSSPSDLSGKEKLTTAWMYPEVLPIIRRWIKWRYTILPYTNNLMWESHLHATPTNAPLFYGPFCCDPVLYTEPLLNGFDAWFGVGKILTAPALFEGLTSRKVYFPKSSADDTSLYFDLHAPYVKHSAGSWATIATPLEHAGLFAREGALIPVGKDYATVTAISGPPRTHVDGVDVVLESQGGVVGIDNYRGVLIFPGTNGKTHTNSWIEDDGISSDPTRCIITITYSGSVDEVEIGMVVEEDDFKPLWWGGIEVILPVGDMRKVVPRYKTAADSVLELTKSEFQGGRRAWKLNFDTKPSAYRFW